MRQFDRVRGIKPGYSVFDLSYEKKFTCDMGELIPVMCDEVVPGDVFDIGMDVVVRAQPLAAPIMHPIYITAHYFYVPYRVLGDHPDVGFDWETFITGGINGTDASTQPQWNVTTNTEGSLWDYLGFPLGVDAAGARPNAWPQLAYNLIWNEFYRDEDLDTAVTIDTQEDILKARWERDYLTAARPYQQRGTSPAMTVTLSGTIDVAGKDQDVTMHSETEAGPFIIQLDGAGADALESKTAAANTADFRWTDPALQVNLASGTATAIDINDLRLNAAIQQFMELSMRAGYRYTEFLQAFFGVGGDLDARLDRPEYLGGTKQWLVVSEVLQTSMTDTTPQGTLVGHGIAVGQQDICKYRVKEHGLIMAMFCIRPRTMYHQGINKQWMRQTRYDYYNPLFAGLSEQEVLESEIYCDGTEAHHNTVFGYIPRYDEMRTKMNMVCGDMHSDYDHWHIGRNFSARPTLNATFVECTPRKDYLATTTEDGFTVSFGNRIRAARPMPMVGTPGMGRL